MILNKMRTKLEELDPNVFYGMVDNKMRDTIWDYIVFDRVRLKCSANRTSYTDYFEVHIIRENYVPDGLDLQVIDKMLEIEGMRLASEDGRYNYIMKSGTNTVIEMLTLTFMRARKTD